jgi:hypothetical protein
MEKTQFEKLVSLAYLVMAVLQVVATWQGLEQSTGAPRMLAMAAAGIVGAVPILGSATGAWGAMTAWGWPFAVSAVAFFWYVPAALIAVVLASRGPSRQRPA